MSNLIQKNVAIIKDYENGKAIPDIRIVNLIKKHLKFYGNSNDYKWGKIIQKMDWIRMRKRIKYANA